MNKRGEWRLSPAFDICHAYRPGSEWVSRHALSVNGQRDRISENDLLAVADSMNVKKPESIVAEIRTQVKQWEKYADEQGVPVKLAKAIKDTLLVFKP